VIDVPVPCSLNLAGEGRVALQTASKTDELEFASMPVLVFARTTFQNILNFIEEALGNDRFVTARV